jgi:hypothetical protein
MGDPGVLFAEVSRVGDEKEHGNFVRDAQGIDCIAASEQAGIVHDDRGIFSGKVGPCANAKAFLLAREVYMHDSFFAIEQAQDLKEGA